MKTYKSGFTEEQRKAIKNDLTRFTEERASPPGCAPEAAVQKIRYWQQSHPTWSANPSHTAKDERVPDLHGRPLHDRARLAKKGETCERLKSGWNGLKRSSNAGANWRAWRTVEAGFCPAGWSPSTTLNRCCKAKRVLLLKQVRAAPPGCITDLARKLRRDRSAVTRDVQALERVGVLRVSEKSLPGHGRQKWIAPIVRDIHLIAQL